jgi:hypothetical protein
VPRYRFTIESEGDTPRDALFFAEHTRPFEDYTVEIMDSRKEDADSASADSLEQGKYNYQFVGDFHASIDLRADNEDSARDKAGSASNERYDFSNDVDDLRLVWSDDPDAEVEN